MSTETATEQIETKKKARTRKCLYGAGSGAAAFDGDDEPALVTGKTESMAAVRLLRLSRMDLEREREDPNDERRSWSSWSDITLQSSLGARP